MKIRIVDQDALLETLYKYCPEYWEDVMEKFPTLDAVPVVRCGECKHRDKKTGWCADVQNYISNTNWFCADGERQDGADDETV